MGKNEDGAVSRRKERQKRRFMDVVKEEVREVGVTAEDAINRQ